VGDNRLAYLNAAHILFGNVADHIAACNDLAVGKGDRRANGVDFRDGVALILLQRWHILTGREIVQIVSDAEDACLAVNGFLIIDLELQPRHRRLLARQDNILKEQVHIRATEVLDFKALDFDFLDKALVVGIQRIQYIDKVVVVFVRGGIVQTEKWVEALEGFLRDLAAHLLWLVENDNRAVSADDVNRPAGGKFVSLGIDDSRFLAFAVLFQ